MAQFINKALPQHQSLLFRLPGELRNRIYEAYFASTLTPEDKVDITHRTRGKMTAIIKAPPTALLRTCQQAYKELLALHREANRWFWERTITITLTDPIYPAAHTVLDPIKNIALDHTPANLTLSPFKEPALIQSQSPLCKLPGELRNRIYEAYLTSTLKPNDRIDLTNFTRTSVIPGGPETGLLSTCQQIHTELLDAHRAASSAFWSDVWDQPAAITLTYDGSKIPPFQIYENPAFAAVKDEELARINNLEFVVRNMTDHPISTLVIKKPGINGPNVFSVGKTTGFLDKNSPVRELVRLLSSGQKAVPCLSKRQIVDGMYWSIAQAVADEEWVLKAKGEEQAGWEGMWEVWGDGLEDDGWMLEGSGLEQPDVVY
nr:hypothetical protein B0A51_17929 [Rachicladosporium sp. CCFEE 5018]